MKKKYLSFLAAMMLSACAKSNAVTDESGQLATTQQPTTTVQTALETEEIGDTFGDYETEDQNTSKKEAVVLALSESTKAQEGISVEGQEITITKAGTYELTGELSAGQVIVNVGKEDKVHLIFSGVAITNPTGPAIFVKQAEKVITTLEEGKTNTLTDGSDYQLGQDETEPDAVFYSKEDLIFNGEGELIVNGYFSNGIRSKDDLTFISGNYTVNAKNNAIKGKDSVQVLDGAYVLTTEAGDAIQSNNSEDATKGRIAIDGGQLTITSGRDGIQAETSVQIQNADITIQTGEATLSIDESYKGIKSGSEIVIQSGVYRIDSADDSLHTNGDIVIAGGEFSFTSGDDGVHADNQLTIGGGKLTVEDSYEGLEASIITINEGEIHVTASDDGLNAAGGSDSDSATGFFGQDKFGGGDQADETKGIVITGGNLYVNAQGDGLDSNGNIEMSAGTVLVDGPTNGGNGSLDYNGTFNLTCGKLITAGSQGMAQNVSETSTQAAVGIYFDSEQEAGTMVSLQDQEGNVVATYQPSKAFQHLLIAVPELSVGTKYTLIKGSQVNGTAQNGYYGTSNIVNGVELGTLSISKTINNLSETGSEVQGMTMGGGPGVNPRPGDGPR